jgi:hypothetical protein
VSESESEERERRGGEKEGYIRREREVKRERGGKWGDKERVKRERERERERERGHRMG